MTRTSALKAGNWRVRYICCGQEIVQPDYFTWWEDADAARQSYISDVGPNGHDKVAIIEANG